MTLNNFIRVYFAIYTFADMPIFCGRLNIQQKVSFEDFGYIIDFVTLVTENKEKLLRLPVCKWKSQLDDWSSSGLRGVRHNDTYEYYIKDL